MLHGAKLGRKLFEVFVRELCPIVSENFLGDAEVGKNVSFVESCDILGCDFGQGLGLYTFFKVIYPYDEVFILVGPHYEGSEDVKAPP